MPYTISQFKERIFKPVFDVYQVFQDFFEPQFTDLQNTPTDEEFQQALEEMEITPTNGLYNSNGRRDSRIRNYYETTRPVIMVWWPRVTVTNESNRSINIQDLYAKIFLTVDGRIPYEFRGFKLNRTTFPEVQFASDYLHSHVPRIYNHLPSWSDPCLGSGPINQTIMDLKNNFDETIWMLFCQELALYVTVESLRGGPYIRMETVGAELESRLYKDYSIQEGTLAQAAYYVRGDDLKKLEKVVKVFVPYYLKHGHLALSYKDGKFVSGMPYFDFIIDISNSFIEFFNQGEIPEISVNWLFDKSILKKAMVANNKFYENTGITPSDFSQYEHTYMFDFKGEPKYLHIEQQRLEGERESVTLLYHSLAMYILTNILKIINYRYRNEHTKQLSSGGGEENSAPTYQTVIYI